MEKKARKFITLLSRSLDKSSDGLKLDKGRRKAFKNSLRVAIEELADGGLKSELLENLKQYTKRLCSLLEVKQEKHARSKSVAKRKKGKEKVQRRTLTVYESLDTPYNFFMKEGCMLRHHIMEMLSLEKQNEIYANFLVQKIVHNSPQNQLQDEDIFTKLCESRKLGRGCKSFPWLTELRTHMLLIVDVGTSVAMQEFMIKLLRMIAADVQICVEGSKVKRSRLLADYIVDILTFSQARMKCLNEFATSPSYGDLVSAILSMYIDLEAICSSKIEGKSYLGKKVSVLMETLLGAAKHQPYKLDVIIQVSLFDKHHLEVLWPLVEHVLAGVPRPLSCTQYVKFVLAVKTARRVAGKERTRQLRKKAYMVAAPSRFLDWLEKVSMMLVAGIPESMREDGLEITKFLMKKRQTPFCNNILDTFSMNASSETSSWHVPDSSEGTDLFFIDAGTDKTEAPLLPPPEMEAGISDEADVDESSEVTAQLASKIASLEVMADDAPPDAFITDSVEEQSSAKASRRKTRDAKMSRAKTELVTRSARGKPSRTEIEDAEAAKPLRARMKDEEAAEMLGVSMQDGHTFEGKATEMSPTKTNAAEMSPLKMKATEVSLTKTKAAEMSPVKSKTADMSLAKTKAAEMSLLKKKAAEMSPLKMKTTEVSPTKTKAAEMPPVKPKTADMSPVESKTAEMSLAKTKAADMSPVESKTAEMSPVRSKTTEMSPAKTKAAEMPPVKSKTADMSPLKTKATEMSPAKTKAAEMSPLKTKAAEMSRCTNIQNDSSKSESKRKSRGRTGGEAGDNDYGKQNGFENEETIASSVGPTKEAVVVDLDSGDNVSDFEAQFQRKKIRRALASPARCVTLQIDSSDSDEDESVKMNAAVKAAESQARSELKLGSPARRAVDDLSMERKLRSPLQPAEEYGTDGSINLRLTDESEGRQNSDRREYPLFRRKKIRKPSEDIDLITLGGSTTTEEQSVATAVPAVTSDDAGAEAAPRTPRREKTSESKPFDGSTTPLSSCNESRSVRSPCRALSEVLPRESARKRREASASECSVVDDVDAPATRRRTRSLARDTASPSLSREAAAKRTRKTPQRVSESDALPRRRSAAAALTPTRQRTRSETRQGEGSAGACGNTGRAMAVVLEEVADETSQPSSTTGETRPKSVSDETTLVSSSKVETEVLAETEAEAQAETHVETIVAEASPSPATAHADTTSSPEKPLRLRKSTRVIKPVLQQEQLEKMLTEAASSEAVATATRETARSEGRRRRRRRRRELVDDDMQAFLHTSLESIGGDTVSNMADEWAETVSELSTAEEGTGERSREMQAEEEVAVTTERRHGDTDDNVEEEERDATPASRRRVTKQRVGRVTRARHPNRVIRSGDDDDGSLSGATAAEQTHTTADSDAAIPYDPPRGEASRGDLATTSQSPKVDAPLDDPIGEFASSTQEQRSLSESPIDLVFSQPDLFADDGAEAAVAMATGGGNEDSASKVRVKVKPRSAHRRRASVTGDVARTTPRRRPAARSRKRTLSDGWRRLSGATKEAEEKEEEGGGGSEESRTLTLAGLSQMVTFTASPGTSLTITVPRVRADAPSFRVTSPAPPRGGGAVVMPTWSLRSTNKLSLTPAMSLRKRTASGSSQGALTPRKRTASGSSQVALTPRKAASARKTARTARAAMTAPRACRASASVGGSVNAGGRVSKFPPSVGSVRRCTQGSHDAAATPRCSNAARDPVTPRMRRRTESADDAAGLTSSSQQKQLKQLEIDMVGYHGDGGSPLDVGKAARCLRSECRHSPGHKCLLRASSVSEDAQPPAVL
ncbi:PREDICTED: serine/arginine repetitive matrix protein 2-like [Priapulus caudatus]|uniref:Serine/arginine repetitive matrix protein 2-like n=1 Tax=Priapulus caudatus TaxID=37621 RepID=A0ABM1DWB7_PRICU|nr:PREDICTED: serine/arginine repetitive matrix protein 2-like [Priapulus caudatus]